MTETPASNAGKATMSPPGRINLYEVDTYTILSRNFNPSVLALRGTQIAELLDTTPGAFRGWVSKKQFPAADGHLDDRTPTWFLKTVVEYVRNAPGGRLGYPVS